MRAFKRSSAFLPSPSPSQLITNFHTEELKQSKIVDFFVNFLLEVDREVNAMKLSVNTRGRAVAENFFKTLS